MELDWDALIQPSVDPKSSWGHKEKDDFLKHGSWSPAPYIVHGREVGMATHWRDTFFSRFLYADMR